MVALLKRRLPDFPANRRDRRNIYSFRFIPNHFSAHFHRLSIIVWLLDLKFNWKVSNILGNVYVSHAHLRRHHWFVVWLDCALVVVLLNHFVNLNVLCRIGVLDWLLHWVRFDLLGWITNITTCLLMFSSYDVLL